MFGYRVEQGSIVILLEGCRGKGTKEEKAYYTPTIELYLLRYIQSLVFIEATLPFGL